MAHLACVEHEKRVVILDVEVDRGSGMQWKVLHRIDSSECGSANFRINKTVVAADEVKRILNDRNDGAAGAKRLLLAIFGKDSN
jgi:hypothetical protein